MPTWIADRANALVWRLPVSRRVRVLLSQLVYRNPPIPSDRVVEAVRALEAAGMRIVLIGGWGIDALVGRQLRPHRDLDLLVAEGELDRAIGILEGIGYAPWNRDLSPGPIGKLPVSTTQTLRNRGLRVVELHEADLGQVRTAEGRIGGRRVTCLPADHQLQAQREIGRTWTPQRRLNKRRNLAAVEGTLRQSTRKA